MASPLPPQPRGADPLNGELVGGKYRLIEEIARGGAGRVYKGIQEPLGRYVAVKLLDPARSGSTNDTSHAGRFIREATFASRLAHPNTVVVHDYGRIEPSGQLYLVMEFLEGPTLRQVLAHAGALALPRALHIGRQIASSLVDAHDAGVVHRDLKPPNILLVQRGGDPDFVKVVDFGLVKSIRIDDDEDLTIEGSFVGSPAYMAPEQATGGPVDVRTDIYAFGTMLYEMLCGRPPFRKPGVKQQPGHIIAMHLTEPPPPLASIRADIVVPPALEALVMRCLGKKPAERPGSMGEVLGVLDQVVRELHAAPVRLPPPLPRTGEDDTERDTPIPHSETGHERTATMLPSRRRRAPWFIGGGVALLALGFLGAQWIHRTVSEPAPPAPTAPTVVTTAAPSPVPPVTATPEPAPPDPAEPAAPGMAAIEPAPPEPVVVQQVADDVTVSLTSTPSDAEIKEGDAVLGRTPFDLTLPRASLAGRTFVIAKEGYEPATVTAPATTETALPLAVTLAPVTVEEPAVGAGPATATSDAPVAAQHKPKTGPRTPKITKPKNDPLDIKLSR